MPIYEYKCEKCGRVVEAFQKFSDDPLTACECGGHLSKLISLNSFHLKGTGWYVTDYAKGKGNQSTAAGAASCETSKGEKADKVDSKKTGPQKTGDDD